MYNKNIFLTIEEAIFLWTKILEEKSKTSKNTLTRVCELYEYDNINEIKYAKHLYKKYKENSSLKYKITNTDELFSKEL